MKEHHGIAPEIRGAVLTLRPGDRLHRLMAMLFDTYFDDLTDERIAEIEKLIASYRFCHANGRLIQSD